MVKKAEAEKFNFPYLYDGEQKVAKNFNAQKTPHAFVIWKENNEGIQHFSPSALIPMLVKALQEADDKIDALTTRIEALEG